MKPTKDNLKDELQFRIECIESSNNEDPMLNLFLENEKSIIREILTLIDIFGVHIGYSEFQNSKYTPIKDCLTKEPLLIGDMVKSNTSNGCGFLYFDDYNNQYLIKTLEGTHHKTSSFVKIEKLFDYTIDNSKVECRPNPNKQKW
ncbi:hypothetical protein JOE44_001954 [Chryseobacterium sp. PvR013]|uniref:hypothetical protein n=1 Tax=Chryseobacterium sp. PvR013 TaxID=2806595 RepID=UPI001AE58697|nr:hypothetical protein [Chryseobacterium sp. PvR013]MBP1165070.1 hypothetical protein [Chryseobacterium sp. PvR013]